jgi:hypothetical protein
VFWGTDSIYSQRKARRSAIVSLPGPANQFPVLGLMTRGRNMLAHKQRPLQPGVMPEGLRFRWHLSLKPGIGVFIFSFALVPAGNGDSLSRFPAATAGPGCRDVNLYADRRDESSSDLRVGDFAELVGGEPFSGNCDGEAALRWQSQIYGYVGNSSGLIRAVRLGELGTGFERSRNGPQSWIRLRGNAE